MQINIRTCERTSRPSVCPLRFSSRRSWPAALFPWTWPDITRCEYACVSLPLSLSLSLCVYIYIYIYIHRHLYTYILTYLLIYLHTYIHTYIHMLYVWHTRMSYGHHDGLWTYMEVWVFTISDSCCCLPTVLPYRSVLAPFLTILDITIPNSNQHKHLWINNVQHNNNEHIRTWYCNLKELIGDIWLLPRSTT